MAYEFNPLIPDCFQKKSEVTPADIQTLQAEISELQESSEDLKQKKVTKFFSANDFLEDNEIAQFQGEDDAANNLQNGFFYKKNPAFTITPNSDTFAYNVNRIMNIRNFDGTSFQQYYLGEVNISTSDYKIIGTSDDTVHTVAFNPSLFVSNYLPATPDGAMVFYPYLLVNGVWDYDNPVTVANGHYIYKGNIINLTQRYAGLIGAGVGADMTSPYRRYLWASILLPNYQACFAFPYATNSSNELIALGVPTGLGAFGFQAYYTISNIAATSINVQGVDLTVNPVFSLSNTEPVADSTKAGLMSAADKIKLDSYVSNGFDFQKNGIAGNITLTERGCVCIRITTFMPSTRDWFEIPVPFTLVWGQVQYLPNTEFNSYAAILTTGNNFITFMLHPTNLAYTTFSVFFPAI